MRATTVAADPGGYAQVFLSVWLRSSAGDAASAQARLAQSMAPGIELPDPATGTQSSPESVTAVRSVQRTDRAWSVTVAAQYAGASVRYFAVPVAADPTGSSFAVTGAPAVVAGPARAEGPKSPYGVTVPDGDLSSAVGEFLTAYLTGAGEVDRYLAPGVQLTTDSTSFYRSVSIQQVVAVEETAAAEQVPADGTTVRVLAQVEARDAIARWPLAYELTLTARSGRWEVAEVQSGTGTVGGVR
jgi:hypothetical protein